MQTFFLIVMIVVVGYLYLRSQRYFARQKNDAASAAGAATTPPEKPYTAVPQDLTRWEVEMHDTARQLSGQLDGKLAALGHLIRDADRVAARLEAALAATRPAALRPRRNRRATRPGRFRPPVRRKSRPSPRLPPLLRQLLVRRPTAATKRSTSWPTTASIRLRSAAAWVCPWVRSS